MDYSNMTDTLKSLLDGYSEDEAKLTSLYKTALENADKAYENELARVNSQFESDRKQVYSDSLRDERNTMNMLAERGLGFSGEAAQAKLNSNILLSNRLGALEREKVNSETKLALENADKANGISLELLEKTGALNDKKNQFKFDIASLEQKIESDNADRLWEQQKHESELQAEREALDKNLQAEKDMLNAELYAKYYQQNNGTDGSNGKNGLNGSGNKNNASENDDIKFTPDISPKDLAKLMVNNATGGNYINDDEQEYIINKYVLDMYNSYDMSDDYLEELIFMLKAYGYKDIGIDGMREQVISYDSDTYYDERYSYYYEKYALAGMDEANSRQNARLYARQDQLDYIKSLAKSRDEFMRCCLSAGIPENEAAAYAKKIVWNTHNFPGGNTVVTRATK